MCVCRVTKMPTERKRRGSLRNKISMNIHVHASEHLWLKTRAKANGNTLAIEVRRLIWDARREAAEDGR